MKRALVIGLNYRDTYAELPGCENDARYYAEYLRSRGVAVEAHTQMQVSDLVDNLYFEAVNSKATDTFYLVYSGHGTQVESATEKDGIDEALVLWTPETGFQALLDDDLRALVQMFKGTVVVILDSCFSGGMQRIAGVAPKHYRRIAARALTATRIIETPKSTAVKYYLLTASREDQPAVDLGENGEFTAALKYAISKGAKTAKSLMRVASTKCPDQQPQLLIERGKSSKILFQ